MDGNGSLHLSELQHACITKNYRVAKTILAQKKCELLPSSQVEEENHALIQVPLYDVHFGYVHFTLSLCIPFSSFNNSQCYTIS